MLQVGQNVPHFNHLWRMIVLNWMKRSLMTRLMIRCFPVVGFHRLKFCFSASTFRTSRRPPTAGRTLSATISPSTSASKRSRSPRPTGPTKERAACGPWTRRRSPKWTRKWKSGPGRIPWPSRRQCTIRVSVVKITYSELFRNHLNFNLSTSLKGVFFK